MSAQLTLLLGLSLSGKSEAAPVISGSLKREPREGKGFLLASPAAPGPLALSQAGLRCRAAGYGENE